VKIRNLTQTFILAITGAVIAFILNFFVLQNIIIPDPCYYHKHDTTRLFDLFYDLPAFEGNHPFPTEFNFILTLVVGAITGIFYSIYRIGKVKRKPIINTLDGHLGRTE
jgi:hypothetical protein